jgi:hypothetical protein
LVAPFDRHGSLLDRVNVVVLLDRIVMRNRRGRGGRFVLNPIFNFVFALVTRAMVLVFCSDDCRC